MEKNRNYRHEYKFLLDARQRTDLYYRLKNILDIDSHAKEEGSYWIRSVYFDDIRDSAFYQNEDGVNERTKYRIRIYNVSDDVIHLECKSKKNSMTNKEMVPLSRDIAMALIDGIPPGISEISDCPELLSRFIVLMQTRYLRAKCIVEYERHPFVCDLGNTRITLDGNISSSMQYGAFFEKDNLRYPVLSAGQSLLEVKYDEYLPTYIKDTLELGRLTQTSFSKYYLGRKYSVPGKGGRLK